MNQSVTPTVPDGFKLVPMDDGFNQAVAPVYMRWNEGSPPSVGIQLAASHLNSMKICHGGVYMTLMDIALASAVGYGIGWLGGFPTVNIDLDYMLPAREGDWLYTEASCTRLTSTLGFAQGFVKSSNGEHVFAKGIFRLPKERAGYGMAIDDLKTMLTS